ncbi:MAG TPA: endonuclease/exonuclease/phosphatase family protein [Beijerinckiaceae bacterium]|jgi:endonuclease/exonuclease/phosphatase family metal-dependent hydrolase
MTEPAAAAPARRSVALRVMTYNVHRWVGTDRRTDPGRIADVIAASGATVVALQEVWRGRARHRGLDQLAGVAERLGMQMHFHPTVRVLGEEYGIAILTAGPSRLVRQGRLPGLPNGIPVEPRGALWIASETEVGEVQVVNAHLGLFGPERRAQAKALTGPDWLGSARTGPAILLGDLNARPGSGAHRRLAMRLRDARIEGSGAAQPTFHARLPLVQLDHVFVDGDVRVTKVEALRTSLTRLASDHLPLVADLAVVASETAGREGVATAA